MKTSIRYQRPAAWLIGRAAACRQAVFERSWRRGGERQPYLGIPPRRIAASFLFTLTLTLTFALTPAAHAQWQTVSYNLKGGWNAIYLHGDATHATPDVLFAGNPEVTEVWRWNPNPNPVQFGGSTLIPSISTPEWSVWRRGQPAQSTLSLLTGQAGYVVVCTGTTANLYSVPITQKIVPPRTTWVRNGANFLGFPSRGGAAYPTFADYFATFPAAFAANSKIYKYAGGPLGDTNPTVVNSPSTEPVDRNQAYWFETQVVGNFYAPLEISPSNLDGLHYARNGALLTVRVRNRTEATATLTIDAVPSAAAPQGQEPITGAVPLMLRTEASSTASAASANVRVGVGAVGVTVGGSGYPAAPAPLVTFSAPPPGGTAPTATATVSGGLVTSISVNTPGSGYASVPSVTIAAPASGVGAQAAVTSLTLTGIANLEGGSGYVATPIVSIVGGGGTGGATAGLADGKVTSITLGGTGYASIPTLLISHPSAIQTAFNQVIGPRSAIELSFGIDRRYVTGAPDAYYASLLRFTDAGNLMDVYLPVSARVTSLAGLWVGDIAVTDVANKSPARSYTCIVRNEGGSIESRAAAFGPSTLRAISRPLGEGPYTYQWRRDGAGLAGATAETLQLTDAQVAEIGLLGSKVARPFNLRTLLHVDNAGAARLLSQVYMGRLAAGFDEPGLCTVESALKADAKLSATRLVATHLPLDAAIVGSGGIVPGGAPVVYVVTVPFTDPTNPFVHTYHPDHNNKDARAEPQPLPPGVESYNIERTCTFQFTTSPPAGTSSLGWGASAIGGIYTETVTGLHKDPIVIMGTFVLRRASEIGAITLN